MVGLGHLGDVQGGSPRSSTRPRRVLAPCATCTSSTRSSGCRSCWASRCCSTRSPRSAERGCAPARTVTAVGPRRAAEVALAASRSGVAGDHRRRRRRAARHPSADGAADLVPECPATGSRPARGWTGAVRGRRPHVARDRDRPVRLGIDQRRAPGVPGRGGPLRGAVHHPLRAARQHPGPRRDRGTPDAGPALPRAWRPSWLDRACSTWSSATTWSSRPTSRTRCFCTRPWTARRA